MREKNVGTAIAIVTLVTASAAVGIVLVTPGTTLTLQTTTSMQDSGLLDLIKPAFEAEYLVNFRWVAVGTGQALTNAGRGDGDVVIVHSASLERAFINHTNPSQTNARLGITYAGQGIFRVNFAYNYYVVVGPTSDPLGISSSIIADNATQIFKLIYTAGHNGTQGIVFVSRGDGSGTNTKEISLWTAAKVWNKTSSWPTNEPKPSPWYKSIGKGMGDTLIFTNEQGAYTLTDYGTWLKMRSGLTYLKVVSSLQCPDLLNIYSVVAVDPQQHSNVNFDLAEKFIYFMVREGQNIIGNYTIDGEQVFHRYVNPDCFCGSALCDVDNGSFYPVSPGPNALLCNDCSQPTNVRLATESMTRMALHNSPWCPKNRVCR